MSKKTLTFLVLSLCLVAAVVLSLAHGHTIGAVVRGFVQDDGFGLILRRIRIPRTILALLVGGSLGVCGVVLQSILQNPLAEPYTLGVSGGASFGITLAALLGLERTLGGFANPISGFAGALFAVSLVYALSRRRFFEPANMVLFGIVISLVFSSLVFFIFSILDPDRMQTTLMWIMGDLSSLEIGLLPAYIPLFLVPAVALLFFGKELDILSLGPEKARYLGVQPARMYRLLFIITSLLTATCVSAAGIIGFVGLIVPHVLRHVMGPGHLSLLCASYLGGAFFLIASDVFSRYLLYPVELPVGVVTGILGGLILLVLILRRK
jgi:iron complex transport system permease protein